MSSNSAPQAKMELALVSEARGCGFESRGARHLIKISAPRVDNGRMLVMLHITDWNMYECFYFPVDSIDCKSVKIHTIWKLSSDPMYTILATADMDIEQDKFENLNIRNWGFM